MNRAAKLRRFRVPGVLLGLLVLSACAGKSAPPVVDRGKTVPGARVQSSVAQARKPLTSGQYRVVQGDTLYSIAFRANRDWKELAASNNIRAPYTIRPGQVISFSGKPARQVAAKPAARPTTQTAATKPAAKPAARQPAASTQKPAAAAPKPVTRVAGGSWHWPAQGTVVSRFSSSTSLNKGIDIAGKLGQPVMAAGNGTVVYAGSDLRGYGELIIIKHDDTFISAYGHNRRLLVNEGQQVKSGQQVAEMGATGTDQVKLHFEIRRQGSPVDPLLYLPKK